MTAPPPKPAPAKPPPLDRSQVYLVESEQDPTALLARVAGIKNGMLFWDDTNRERLQPVDRITTTKSGAVNVYTKSGAVYRFTPLTLELYEQKVRSRVELSPRFESTKALVDFYKT